MINFPTTATTQYVTILLFTLLKNGNPFFLLRLVMNDCSMRDVGEYANHIAAVASKAPRIKLQKTLLFNFM